MFSPAERPRARARGGSTSASGSIAYQYISGRLWSAASSAWLVRASRISQRLAQEFAGSRLQLEPNKEFLFVAAACRCRRCEMQLLGPRSRGPRT